MTDPTYRMSMLPFGTYPNEDGQGEHLGLAVPGMIQEPVNALMRLFGTPSNPGTFGQGPDAPGNADDMRTLLFSMYGGNAMNPGRLLEGAAAKAETAPQRFYHGTGAADDFSTFKPSESGAFGPGVYASKDPAYAAYHAGVDDGARVMPIDVTGPFASMDDYLTTLHANGRDPNAALNALLEQGYTGVTGDIGGSNFSNVTNVFKPGSVRSATTGETLFSDTGKPSLFGAAVAGAGRDEGQTLASNNLHIYDPPRVSQRPFAEDYPDGAIADASGRLYHDIDGRSLTAPYIAGRVSLGAPDQAIPPAQLNALTEALTGKRPQDVETGTMPGTVGGFLRPVSPEYRDARRVLIDRTLASPERERVLAHELGHAVDYLANPEAGIPLWHGHSDYQKGLLSEEYGQVYHDLNAPDPDLRGMALTASDRTSPENFGYSGDWDISREYMAEALRAYMTDPNYMKSVAPTAAERIRAAVNGHPELSRIIQFNSDGLPSLFGSALAPYQQEPRNALLDY